jgi:hypothetical protein
MKFGNNDDIVNAINKNGPFGFCNLPSPSVVGKVRWDNFIFLKEMSVTIQGLESGLVDQSSGGHLPKDNNVF